MIPVIVGVILGFSIVMLSSLLWRNSRNIISNNRIIPVQPISSGYNSTRPLGYPSISDVDDFIAMLERRRERQLVRDRVRGNRITIDVKRKLKKVRGLNG